MSLRKLGKGAKEFICVFLCSIVYIFAVLIGTGTLTSGYHLIDDHEILLYANYFQEGTYTWKTILSEGLFDYFEGGMRFRPLYFTLRLLRSWLLGANFTAWSVVVGLEIVGCLIAAYYIMRRMGVNCLCSGLASFLLLTGGQSEIWWRLGPQEPTGLLMWLLCMLLIQEYERKPGVIRGILVVVFGFLMAASKESFTLLLPSLGLFCIGYDFWLSGYESLWKGIVYTLRKNIFIFAAMFLNLCVNMYIIIYRVGLLSIGYAGVDMDAGASGYLNMLREMLKWDSMKSYEYLQSAVVILALISLIVGIRKDKRKEDGKRGMQKVGKALLGISFASIMLSQLILYARSGMSARYFVPFTVGFVGMNVAVILSGMKNRYCRWILIGIIGVALIPMYYGVWNEGKAFAIQGRRLNTCLEMIESSYGRDDTVIIGLNDDESNRSMALYLSMNSAVENICIWKEEGIYSLDGEFLKEGIDEVECLILAYERELSELGLEEDSCENVGDMGYGYMYVKNTEKVVG